MLKMEDIARELNRRSEGQPIGSLQDIRQALRGLSRRATSGIFGSQSIQDDYAFHLGGRTELQFNIGWESIEGRDRFRHGVAFSLEPSQTLPSVDPLLPKIARFNEFVRSCPEKLSQFRMWHYQHGKRSETHSVSEVAPELASAHAFIFIGHLSESASPDYDRIIDDFNVLLPLYRFVEGEEELPVFSDAPGFRFSAGCTLKPISTTATLAERTLDISLRHNILQLALYNCLAKRHGADNVGTEIPGGQGTRLDVVVRENDGFHVFEIKTARSARACIREALAQLMEYSYWPGMQEAALLYIVGEPPITEDCKSYLSLLRQRFSLPVYYCQLLVETEELISHH